MAKYFDSYEIELQINNIQTDLDPTMYQFSISDSIHQLYPQATLSVLDQTGLLQELLTFSEGIPIKFTYGFSDYTPIQNTFVVIHDQLDKAMKPLSINGVVTSELIHKYFQDQEIKSAGYSNNISSIIQQLASSYQFNTVNISSTQNNSKWYQPLMTDADFMINILLPNCYSSSSNQSPFFLWIDCANNFNLKSYSEMLNQNPTRTLNYLQKDSKKLDRDTILDFRRFKTGSTVNEYTKKRKVYVYDLQSGEYENETDTIISYPSNNNGQNLSIIKNNKLKSFIDLGDKKKIPSERNNVLGRQINKMKDSLFLERMMITTYLDTDLRAGKTVNIEIPDSLSKNNADSSVYFSGKYLIEESNHIWDSAGKQGYTKLLISRKSFMINSQYTIKSQLF